MDRLPRRGCGRSWHVRGFPGGVNPGADPSNGVGSLIVVTPVFVPFAKFDQPQGHHRLSWNDTNDAAADLALLSTVDAIATSGYGDASQLYLWGFSAGGGLLLS